MPAMDDYIALHISQQVAMSFSSFNISTESTFLLHCISLYTCMSKGESVSCMGNQWNMFQKDI